MNSKALTLVIVLNLLFAYSAIGQNRKIDVIRKITGDTLGVYVTSITEKNISYTYPNEQVTYVISRNTVNSIEFGSGRTEFITSMVSIMGEQDWEKVKLTTLPSDIEGLTQKGEVKANANTAFKNAVSMDNVMVEKIKKQAAALYAHIVLIESRTAQANGNSAIVGKAYGY